MKTIDTAIDIDASPAAVWEVLADTGHAGFVTARVRAAIEADPTLAGRLALWARRLVGEALAQVDGETEAATARALVERKLRAAPSGTPDVLFRRLVGLLARKGYPAGLAVSVVKEVLAARDEEYATFADAVDPDALTDLVGEADDPMR